MTTTGRGVLAAVLPALLLATVGVASAAPAPLGGARLSVAASASVLPTASVFDLNLHVTDTDGWLTGYDVDWGDGTSDITSSSEVNVCTSTKAVPLDQTVRLQHAYRLPGLYLPVVTITTTNCANVDDTATSTTPLTITPGPMPSNGPRALERGLLEAKAAAHVGGASRFSQNLFERDGYVESVTVQWGDGNTTVKRFPLAECNDPVRAWPSTERFLNLGHRYAMAGRYRIKSIVRSVGCDGSNPQTTVRSIGLTQAG